MRRRAFTPESPLGLEGRIVLSAVGPAGRPFGLSAETYGVGTFQVKNAFQLYGNSGDLQRLRTMLAADSVGIPYHRATGLGPKTNVILAQMQANLQTHVPHAISSAMHQTLHGIHSDVVKLIKHRAVFVVRSA